MIDGHPPAGESYYENGRRKYRGHRLRYGAPLPRYAGGKPDKDDTEGMRRYRKRKGRNRANYR